MSGRSPIDSLRQLAPVSDAQAAETFGAAGREELLDGVTGLPVGHETRKRPVRRRRLALAVALLVAVATTATAWAVLRGSAAHETTSVQCVIGESDAIIPSASGNPAHDCAVDYRREFGIRAPRLVAYDNGLGGVTVIPRSQTPQAGWKRLVSGQDVDLIQLQDSLDDYINGLNASCLDGAAATSFTQSKLAQFGFTGWTVSMHGPGSAGSAPPTRAGTKKAPATESDGSSCWNVDVVEPSTQTVTLLAGPDQNGGTPTELADKLRPVTQTCQSLPAAVASVRATASTLGLSENAREYDLNTVVDTSMRCASIYETVGGTIFLTVRGQRG